MHGRAAVREQLVRPFIAGFPGNRHVVRNMIVGRDTVVVEFTFQGRSATDAGVQRTGCGVYEYDPIQRQITAARIYFDAGTLLNQAEKLHRAHEVRESQIRRLADANIVGVLISSLDGHVDEANDAFLGIVRFTRDDLRSGRLKWTELTPPEWQAPT